jgi:hypothetical protein
VAQKSKLTPEVQERTCQLIRAGNTVEVASEASGITPTTFYNWMQRTKANPMGRFVRPSSRPELRPRRSSSAESTGQRRRAHGGRRHGCSSASGPSAGVRSVIGRRPTPASSTEIWRICCRRSERPTG